jgi:hypothetical protein
MTHRYDTPETEPPVGRSDFLGALSHGLLIAKPALKYL